MIDTGTKINGNKKTGSSKMKVNAKSLKQAIAILEKATGKSKSLPILRMVHAEQVPSGIRFTATDLSERVCVSITGEGTFAAVPVMLDLCKVKSALKTGDAEIAVTGEVVTVDVGGFKVDISDCHSPNDFPIFLDIGERKYEFPVNSEWSGAFLEAYSHAAEDDSRKILFGVCVSDKGVCGTDGKRAYINEQAVCPVPWLERVSVPVTKCLTAILKQSPGGMVSIYGKKNEGGMDSIYVGFNSVGTPGMLIEYRAKTYGTWGNFPNYFQILPENRWNVEAAIEPEVFQGLCKAGNVVKRDEACNCVGLEYVSGEFKVTCKDFTGSLPVTEKAFIPEVPVEPVAGTYGPSSGQPGSVRSFGLKGSFLQDIANIGVTGIKVLDGYSPIRFDLVGGGYSIVAPIRRK